MADEIKYKKEYYDYLHNHILAVKKALVAALRRGENPSVVESSGGN